LQIISIIMEETYIYFNLRTTGAGTLTLPIWKYGCTKFLANLNYLLVDCLLGLSFICLVQMLTLFPLFDSSYESLMVCLQHMTRNVFRKQHEPYRPSRNLLWLFSLLKSQLKVLLTGYVFLIYTKCFTIRFTLFSPGIGVIDPCMISTFCLSCLATFTSLWISREIVCPSSWNFKYWQKKRLST